MDISGKNRYELLFMDDDSVNTQNLCDSVVLKKNDVDITNNKPASGTKKNVEKENKSGALNKNDMPTKKTKAGFSGNVDNNNRISEEGEPRKVSFKSQNNEGRDQRNNRRNVREGGSNGAEFSNEHRETRQFRDRDNRGPSRNREAGYRGGKREFDRQSGSDKTGVKAIDKRDGAGAHNWGSVKQEIDDINKSTADADVPSSDKEESSNEQTCEQSAVTEEVKEFTLDEWKAMRGERTKPQYNLRKANEGEDNSEWKKMIMLNKKKEDDSEEEYEYDPSMYPQRVGRLQRIVDIQFNFNDGRRGGFGRGRGRGSRPGGNLKAAQQEGERQPRQQRNFCEKQQKRSNPKVLKVDDERQFPTLS